MVDASILTRIAPLSQELSATAERLKASVVAVQSGDGGGAGIIWSPDGLIVTNDHVLRGQRLAVMLAGGERLAARILGRDPESDLAALRVERTGLPVAPVGDSRALRVGQLVIAVGHPLGVERAVTTGIVSALPAPGERRGLIRADVAIGPGNSGGPLADAEGRVLGINTMVASPGVGLAVPAHAVEAFLAVAGAPLPYLGIVARAVALPEGYRRQLGLPLAAGLIVTGVEPDSPAHAANLLPGDVIVAVGTQAVWDPRQLRDAIALAGPGGRLHLTVLRGGQPLDVIGVLGQPRSPSRAKAA